MRWLGYFSLAIAVLLTGGEVARSQTPRTADPARVIEGARRAGEVDERLRVKRPPLEREAAEFRRRISEIPAAEDDSTGEAADLSPSLFKPRRARQVAFED